MTVDGQASAGLVSADHGDGLGNRALPRGPADDGVGGDRLRSLADNEGWAKGTDWPRRVHATTTIPASGTILRC